MKIDIKTVGTRARGGIYSVYIFRQSTLFICIICVSLSPDQVNVLLLYLFCISYGVS